MGNSLLSKVIYFWIFIIGGMFIAKLFGFSYEVKDTIIFLIILSCFYWGFAFLRAQGKKKRGK